jgi:DNA-binding GntR family transcriptional regulator
MQNAKYNPAMEEPSPHLEPARGVIGRPSLHREIAERLRDMVVDGTLPSGADINERALCAQFGVSRTPMREAFLVLAAEGLLEIVPRRGARVAAPNADRIRDILELLGGVEGLAGELACARATPAEIAAIEASHAAMLARFAAGDMLPYFKLNERIHDLIVSAAHNAEMAAQHAILRDRVLRWLYLPNMRPERWREAITEHEGFIAALRARDGAGLGGLLRRHKAHTWRELSRRFECGSTVTTQETSQ